MFYKTSTCSTKKAVCCQVHANSTEFSPRYNTEHNSDVTAPGRNSFRATPPLGRNSTIFTSPGRNSATSLHLCNAVCSPMFINVVIVNTRSPLFTPLQICLIINVPSRKSFIIYTYFVHIFSR